MRCVSGLIVYRSYNNATAVEQEVNRIKHRTNLLLWYTADEYAFPSFLLQLLTLRQARWMRWFVSIYAS